MMGISTDGRPLDLIKAEVSESLRELADLVREQARFTLIRADAIEKSAASEDATDSSKEESEAIAALTEDQTLNNLRQSEIRCRLERLGFERGILSRRAGNEASSI